MSVSTSTRLLAALALLTLAACDATDPGTEAGEVDGDALFALSSLSCSVDGVNSDPYTVADAMADNDSDHEDADDYTYSAASATTVTLSGSSISVTGSGATASGSTVTIAEPGTYVLSGTLDDGQVVVDSPDDGTVQLVLDGVSIANSGDSGILVVEGDKTVLVLADGSTNTVSDGASYPADAEQNAAVWADDDLSIGGSGSLTVTASFEDGIAGKNGFVIAGGTITVTAPDEGIRGKDYLVVRGGTLDVTAGGDGLKSDEDDDAEHGYVLVEGGTVTVEAAGDALSAETDALVTGGTLVLSAGGGGTVTPDDDVSTKGLKGGALVVIDGGTLVIDTSDDGVHSNSTVVINDGSIEIATGDDGVHADSTVTVNGGDLVVTRSYEAIENGTGYLTFNGGTARLTASDDGINVAGTGDSRPGGGTNGAYVLVVNGGRISVDAEGDGLDSNGSIEMTGGCLLVSGPTRSGNAAIDYDGSFDISGGVLAAAGPSGMAQMPGSGSSQPSLGIRFSSTPAAGTVFALHGEDGEALAVAPSKAYPTMVVSAPWLGTGETVGVYLGGTASGLADDGIADGGSYSGGALQDEVAVTSVTTTVTL